MPLLISAVSVEITQGLAKQWTALSAEEKIPYQKLADEENAAAAARGDTGDEEKKPRKRKRGASSGGSKKGGGAPKRPPTAPRLFAAKRKEELQAEDPGLSAKEIKEKCTEEWKNMSVRNTEITKERETDYHCSL